MISADNYFTGAKDNIAGLQRQPGISLARELLDWAPGADLEAGLERTVAYFSSLVDSRRA